MRFRVREKTRAKPGAPVDTWQGEPSDEWTKEMGWGAMTVEMRGTLQSGLVNVPSVEGNARWLVNVATGEFLMGWAFVCEGGARAPKWVFVTSENSLARLLEMGTLEADPFTPP